MRAPTSCWTSYADQAWTMGPRLVLTRRQGNWQIIKEAARAILATGAGPRAPVAVRTRTASRARAPDEALAAAIGVAREPSAPQLVRTAAFAIAVRILGPIKNEWRRARELLDEWTQVAPGDPKASAFMPTIMRHVAAQ